jgi:hypothetical protein
MSSKAQTKENPVEQAFDLYSKTYGSNADQPTHWQESAEVIDGDTYVIFRNIRGVLAVYTVDPEVRELDEQDWPDELLEEA